MHLSHRDPSQPNVIPFWQRVLTDGTLRQCGDLEKLLAGCEIIAAVDDAELLAA